MKRAQGEKNRKEEAEGTVRRSQVGVFLFFSCRFSLMLVEFSRQRIRPDRGTHVTLCTTGGEMGGGDRCGRDRDRRLGPPTQSLNGFRVWPTWRISSVAFDRFVK